MDEYGNIYGLPIFGETSDRPSVNVPNSFQYYDTDLGKAIWWNGTTWVDNDDNPADAKMTGTTDERPTGVKIGYIYKDTTLDALVVWNGTAWVDNKTYCEGQVSEYLENVTSSINYDADSGELIFEMGS